jgi:hypothetical protein
MAVVWIQTRRGARHGPRLLALMLDLELDSHVGNSQPSHFAADAFQHLRV